MKRLVILLLVGSLAGCGSTYAQRRSNRQAMMMGMGVLSAVAGGAAIGMAMQPSYAAPAYSPPPPSYGGHSSSPPLDYMSGGPSVSGYGSNGNDRCAWDTTGTGGCTVE